MRLLPNVMYAPIKASKFSYALTTNLITSIWLSKIYREDPLMAVVLEDVVAAVAVMVAAEMNALNILVMV
jgi:hypothetical protein